MYARIRFFISGPLLYMSVMHPSFEGGLCTVFGPVAILTESSPFSYSNILFSHRMPYYATIVLWIVLHNHLSYVFWYFLTIARTGGWYTIISWSLFCGSCLTGSRCQKLPPSSWRNNTWLYSTVGYLVMERWRDTIMLCCTFALLLRSVLQYAFYDL